MTPPDWSAKVGTLVVILILAMSLLVPNALAKPPFQVAIYLQPSNDMLGTIESEEDLIALFGPILWEATAVFLPLDVKPARWDLRLVAYFDVRLEYPTELLYVKPQDQDLGVLYWEEAPTYSATITQPLLAQSRHFDAVLTPFLDYKAESADSPLVGAILYSSIAAIVGLTLGLLWIRTLIKAKSSISREKKKGA